MRITLIMIDIIIMMVNMCYDNRERIYVRGNEIDSVEDKNHGDTEVDDNGESE